MAAVTGDWVPRILLGLAVLFTGAAIYNLATGEMAEGLVGLAVGAFLGGVLYFLRRGEAQNEELEDWVKRNAAGIRGGGADRDGVLVTPETRLRQYTYVISLIVLAVRVPSRLRVLEHDEQALGAAVACSLISFVLGWWSLSGLIWTPQAIYKNLRGGNTLTVESLLPSATFSEARSLFG